MSPTTETPHTIDADITQLLKGSIILLNLDFFQSDHQFVSSLRFPPEINTCECLVIDTLKPTDPIPSLKVIPLIPESQRPRDSGEFPYMTTLITDGGLINRWYSPKIYPVEPSSYGPKVKHLPNTKITDDQLKNILGSPS